MDRDVLQLVIGDAARSVEMAPASIRGFFKARLPHESYPMLVPHADGEAAGQLLYGLNAQDLDRIVFFEGEEYELSPCKVLVDNSEQIDALFFDEGIMPPAETVAWDFDEWRDTNKAYMLRQSEKYMSYYGQMTSAEADEYWQNYEE